MSAQEMKPQIYHCKRCLRQYKLGIPYDQANSPARDLCDDCIVDLAPDEFKSFNEPIEI